MRISTMVKGAATMAVIGTAAYMLTNSSPSTKRKLKRSTGKALHSFGDMCNDVSRMI